MALQYSINVPTTQNLYPSFVAGLAATDATAFPNFVGATTTAGSAVITGVTTTSAFYPNCHLWLNGAASKIDAMGTTVSANTSLTTTNTTLLVNDTVTVYNMQDQLIFLPLCPKKIVWRDRTNGINWTWDEGMPWGACERYVWATGVTTLVTNFDIMVRPNYFAVSPTAAPVSSGFSFEVWG